MKNNSTTFTDEKLFDIRNLQKTFINHNYLIMNTIKEKYAFFSRKEFDKLAAVHDLSCVSIYIPTYRAGKEVDQGHQQIALKNELKKATNMLIKHKGSKAMAQEYLRPIELLLDEVHFWRNQSDGLAIFLDQKSIRYYRLPIDFKSTTYVGDHFYLKPLLPFFTGDGSFYILKIDMQSVSFFKANKYSITKIDVQDLVPTRLEEAVGYQVEEGVLQTHAVGVGSNDMIFHGHGVGKDDEKIEIEKYFRSIDKGIKELITNEETPLIVACQNQYFAKYKKVSGYSNLVNENIDSILQDDDPYQIHEKAWRTLGDYFDQDRKEALNTFSKRLSEGRASDTLEDIISASFEGRVKTLFVNNEEEIYGLYDPTFRTTIVDEEKSTSNASLLNLAAINSFSKGAKVYVMTPEEMPVAESLVNAIYRY